MEVNRSEVDFFMLDGLCGNKNVQKILIFLFVNGKCYGTQLHRVLSAPLTPLQKALARLEKTGVIASYYEGKTRVYHFNPAYSLLQELEQLLKKAYTLLPATQKKQYYVPKEDLSIAKATVLLSFWEKLKNIKELSFQAKSKSNEERGSNGNGKGEVVVSKEGDTRLIFHEKGMWQGHQGGELSFTNVFRWTLDRSSTLISLEHLRRGEGHPVFLFHLTPCGKQALSSISSHLCESDTYFAHVHFDEHSLKLSWRVIGPKKNEEIDYYYM